MIHYWFGPRIPNRTFACLSFLQCTKPSWFSVGLGIEWLNRYELIRIHKMHDGLQSGLRKGCHVVENAHLRNTTSGSCWTWKMVLLEQGTSTWTLKTEDWKVLRSVSVYIWARGRIPQVHLQPPPHNFITYHNNFNHQLVFQKTNFPKQHFYKEIYHKFMQCTWGERCS